jgi:ribosome biogenesis GTPase A
MSSAVLSEREFIAERGALTFVGDGPAPAKRGEGLTDVPSGVVKALSIPRRPAWDTTMTAVDVRKTESNSFLEWRRGVAIAEAKYSGGATGAAAATVTPFEKNIEVWRQLWRVVEKSDVLVQIVDGRNPLMFLCPDLNSYVKEVNSIKQTLLLVNKADFLNAQQRYAWAKYFVESGIEFRFFSAKRESLLLEAQDKINMAAKTKAAIESGQLDEHTPFSPDTNTIGRMDLSAGIHGHVQPVTETENIPAPSVTSTAPSAAPSFLSKSITNARIGRKGGASFQEDLRKLLLGEEGEDSSEEESTEGGAPEEGDEAPDHDEEEQTEEDAEEEQEEEEEEEEVSPPLPSQLEDMQHTGDLTGLDPQDPLYPLCKVLSRDELISFLEHRYESLPRGARLGAADEVARRKHAELKDRRKEQLMAAREEELRRRKLMTSRLIEVGLGAQVRFGDAKDIEALETADFEETEYDAAEDDIDAHQPLVVGMVGYPNVGKSSTINALMGATANNHHAKRVAVASTPGKTKHFQTLELNDEVTLCDCPGLVFPSFVSTREEMVVNGVLPIDQLRDYPGVYTCSYALTVILHVLSFSFLVLCRSRPSPVSTHSPLHFGSLLWPCTACTTTTTTIRQATHCVRTVRNIQSCPWVHGVCPCGS